ncbi:MAG: 30S ribosomal protein S1 [Armatimonadetes bacterium]|nr:30S ribosomal protein S1 [Armatimonadota bacterium]
MFQDKADPLRMLRLGFSAVTDQEAGDVAGGGGGPEPPDDVDAAVQAADTSASGDVSTGEDNNRVQTGSSEEPDVTMSDADAFEEALREMPVEKRRVDYSGTFQALREHDVVEGIVVHIDREGVLVDVGMKSEGVIRMNELTRDPFQNPEDVVSVGERIKVYVLETESQDGQLLLSKKRADFEVAWERVEEASKSGKVLTAMVSDRVKGGLVVDLGIRGFVPASHVGSGKVQNLDKFIGQSLPLKVIEVDRERRKVVLSHRNAIEEEREKKRSETLETLAEGQIRTGVVRRITDYGAFVDLGGIDGLLHISEMSWTRINHPSEAAKVGQKIQVMVLKMNLESGRVSLGMRQILPDPWQGVGERFHIGDVVNGKVTRLVPFGAFVQLEEGVEAIVPNSELSHRRVKKPEQVVSVGDDVEAKVLDVRPEERRMTLSMRALMQDRGEEPMHIPQPSYSGGGGGGGGREAPRTTIADMLGEGFAEKRLEFERELEGKGKGKRRKEKARAAERAEEEAYGDLSDEELLDLAVTPAVEEEPDHEEAEADVQAASSEEAEDAAPEPSEPEPVAQSSDEPSEESLGTDESEQA